MKVLQVLEVCKNFSSQAASKDLVVSEGERDILDTHWHFIFQIFFGQIRRIICSLLTKVVKKLLAMSRQKLS